MKEKWALYYNKWKESIPDFINTKSRRILRAAQRIECLWADWYWTNEYPEITYLQLVEEMKQSLLMLWNKLDQEINAY